jgi:hypothetical protein
LVKIIKEYFNKIHVNGVNVEITINKQSSDNKQSSEIDLNNDETVVFDDVGEFDSSMLRPMQED